MIATANAVRLCGARPVLVDVCPETLCAAVEELEAARTPRTRAVLVVSLNGRAPQMDRIAEFCRRQDLLFFEDAAQSLGSKGRDGAHLGTYGDGATFSLSAAKTISTGQGGAIATKHLELHARVKKLKDFGRRQPGQDETDSLGFNFKYNDLLAVVGRQQLRKLPQRLELKRRVGELYRQGLGDLPQVRLLPSTVAGEIPWFFDIFVDDREALQEELKECGIGTRPFYPPIHTQAAYADEYRTASFAVAEEASRTGLWLPSGPDITCEQVEETCRHIRRFYGRS